MKTKGFMKKAGRLAKKMGKELHNSPLGRAASGKRRLRR
jgi:hypothetical protein